MSRAKIRPFPDFTPIPPRASAANPREKPENGVALEPEKNVALEPEKDVAVEREKDAKENPENDAKQDPNFLETYGFECKWVEMKKKRTTQPDTVMGAHVAGALGKSMTTKDRKRKDYYIKQNSSGQVHRSNMCYVHVDFD